MLEEVGLHPKHATLKSARGEYEHYTPKEKVWVRKRAVENGLTAVICYFSEVFPDHSLKERTVRTWKKYLHKISGRK